MSKAAELRKDFEDKLAELQSSCLHKETKTMPYYWAPAHYGGEVTVCLECDKILNGPNWEIESLPDKEKERG